MTTDQKARKIAKDKPNHFRFALQYSLHRSWTYVAHDGRAHKVDSVPLEHADRWVNGAPNPAVGYYCPICEGQKKSAAQRSRMIASRCLMTVEEQP